MQKSLKNIFVLDPGYEWELWKLADFGSEGHPEKMIFGNFEGVYGWHEALSPNLPRLSSDDDIR